MNQSAVYKSWRLSTDVNFGTIWDNHTITERWHIERVDGQALKANDISAIMFDTSTGGPVVPTMDDPYYFPTGGLGTTWMESALVRSLQWNGMEGKGLGLTVTYGTRYFEAAQAKGMASNSEDMSAATVLSRGLFLPCACLPVFMTRSFTRYRDGAAAPPAALDISTTDIGGTQKELDQDSRQIGLKLRMLNDTNSLTMLGSTVSSGLVGVAQACLGYKNLTKFLGRDAGTIVCTGATVNHLEGEFFEFVLEFLYDEYAHHSQIVTKATDGRPKMSGNQYAEVFWARPARGTVEFNSIWPVGDLGKSMKWQAYAGRWY